MIILQSIRVRNFRAIAEATFKPLEEGITGIIGQNGAGKTTFLSASMWALFGVRPPDASVGSLRREGSKGECSVSVVFRHLGQQIEVIRELKGGGKSNHTVVNIFVEGIEQTVASVSAADQWIVARLGVDATGFLTAFVVRQKELDQLITATPAVRKALIEKLAGVDTINAALKSAREDENQAKRILASAYGSEEEVNTTENNMNLLADRYEQMSVNREALLNKQQALTSRLRATQATIDGLRNTQLTLTREEPRLEALRREQEDLTTRKAALSYVAEMTGSTDDELESLRQQHVRINGELSTLSTKVNNAKLELKTAETAVNQAAARLDAITQFLTDNQLDTPFPPDTLEAELTTRREAVIAANERRAVLTSRIENFEESIHTLGHSAECPVCHSTLADPEGLVKTFRDTILEAQAEINGLQDVVLKARQEGSEIEQAIMLRDRITKETDERGGLQRLVEENQAKIAQLRDAIGADESAAALLAEELEQVRNLGVKARGLADDRKTYADLSGRLEANVGTIAEIERTIKACRKELKDANFDTLQSQAHALQAEIEQNEPDVQMALGNIGELEASLANAKSNYRRAVEDWNRRKDLLKRQERFSLTTDLLDRFRRDTIASLAPEISDYATNLISEMTSGEFSDIKLDEEFNASVTTAEGDVRPVAWLSGGELSAVALALRIAIGYLITGGNPELLWLDEVLTAQDADRRASMLSLIRTLPIDQIIMINHTAEASDIVDKTIILNKDRKNGSYIATD